MNTIAGIDSPDIGPKFFRTDYIAVAVPKRSKLVYPPAVLEILVIRYINSSWMGIRAAKKPQQDNPVK